MVSDNDRYSEIASEGVLIIDNENFTAWNELSEAIVSNLGVECLSRAHDFITGSEVNEKRLNAFRALNSVTDWDEKYFSMAKSALTALLGPDLLIQRKLNLSIQMPEDQTSKLGMHADTLSGQSPFEVVMWTAFSDFAPEAGMYYFDVETSKLIFNEMQNTEENGLESLREKYWTEKKFLNISKSQIAIFTGTVFHGNITNETSDTRVSVNCRFKNVFSPEGEEFLSERGVGIFYKQLCLSPITQIAKEYILREVKF